MPLIAILRAVILRRPSPNYPGGNDQWDEFTEWNDRNALHRKRLHWEDDEALLIMLGIWDG